MIEVSGFVKHRFPEKVFVSVCFTGAEAFEGWDTPSSFCVMRDHWHWISLENNLGCVVRMQG